MDFLRRLKLASPIKIIKLLTDNGSQFTDRFATKDRKPSGQHAFDRVCAGMGIEHRLAPPRHPQTNGMVERFNGRISELLQQTRFDSRADLETTLLNYLKLYNHHIPQRAISSKTPIQTLKEWQEKKPELFVRRLPLGLAPARCDMESAWWEPRRAGSAAARPPRPRTS